MEHDFLKPFDGSTEFPSIILFTEPEHGNQAFSPQILDELVTFANYVANSYSRPVVKSEIKQPFYRQVVLSKSCYFVN